MILILKVYLFYINISCSFQTIGDVNGDSRSDIVCVGSEGSMMVWEAKDEENENIYDPNSKWTDDHFGFCAHEYKKVSILV